MNVGQAVGRSFFEATQVALVVWLTVLWSPKALFPTEIGWLIDLCTVFIIAVLMMLIRLLALPRARLDLCWTRGGDAQELHQVDALFNQGTREGEFFIVKVRSARAWGLGWIALQIAVHRGLWVRTRSAHAHFALIPDLERDFDSEPTARAGKGCQVLVKLPPPIPEGGDDWNDVWVKPRGSKPNQLRQTALRHSAHVDGKFGWLCAMFIKVDSKALKITERWS